MYASLAKNIAIGRIALGISAWLAPSLTNRIFGIDPDGPPIIGELFGIRELALGLLGLSGSRAALQAGVLVDSADAIATLRETRGGRLSKRTTFLLGTAAVSATAIGIGALAEDSGPEPAV
jgi:hypothetical protein